MSYKEEAEPIYKKIKERTNEFFETPDEDCLDGEINRQFQLDIMELNNQLREIKKKYEGQV